ncbi:polyamine-modulated factor 1-binding protein 1-like [Simochromis diagramma]|uniref:polyamine-modulated factor 1-binding protein 1-like n=1 Tax=Simochromis diagramma TaxID=43689 RepID=UPI001A7E8A45|nr:polyamine-modulated factor 1-binding protein 1-like [Simochromis diagramma]
MSESPSISSDVMEENENLRQQVREFKDENENLRKTIELLLKEYGFSKNKKKRELQLQNEKLCLENSELNYSVAYLQCENQALRQQVQAKESAYEQNDQEWKSALEQLKNNLKMPCKHEEYEMEKLALQEKVEDLQTDNQALRSENDAIIQSMCDLKQTFQNEKDKMRQQIQALQTDIHEANASLENFRDFKELYEELKQENESLNNQNQDLKQEIEAKIIAIQEEVKELKSFEEESNRIKEQNNALEQEVQELTKKLADCQKEMRQNEQPLEERMHRKHVEYEMEKITLLLKVEDLQTDNQAFQTNIEELLKQLESSEDEKNIIRQYNKALEQELTKTINDCRMDVTKTINDCWREMRQNEQALQEEMHLQLEEYEMEKLALQEKVENLQTENQAFRSENDVTIQSMCDLKQTFQKERDKMRQQIQVLQNDIHEANSKGKEN